MAINDPINYTLDKAEWLYTSAGASTTVLANAANVGTTPEAAVLGDHSGGIGMAGSTKRDPDGDGSIHVYDYGADQGWGFATPTESADGVPNEVWKQNNNGYYSTRVYPDEDVTLTVTDSGDYTITIPTLPTLGDGWDYQIKQAKNGVDPRFYFSSDDSSHFATLTIYAEGNDNVPIAGDDAAAVFEDENVAILNTSTAANMSGGDNASAVDLPGEHTGNLLLMTQILTLTAIALAA